MADELRVRPAVAADAPAIAQLSKAFMGELAERGMLEPDLAAPGVDRRALEKKWAALLTRRISAGQVSVLERGGVVAGFADFRTAKDCRGLPRRVAYVVDVFVSPESRRLGAATRLLDHLLASAQDAGLKEAWVNTHKDNREMRGLLHKLRFTVMTKVQVPGLTDHLVDQVYYRKAVE